MYPVHGAKGPCGVSIPKGWTIVEQNGNLFYVREKAVVYTLEFLNKR